MLHKSLFLILPFIFSTSFAADSINSADLQRLRSCLGDWINKDDSREVLRENRIRGHLLVLDQQASALNLKCTPSLTIVEKPDPEHVDLTFLTAQGADSPTVKKFRVLLKDVQNGGAVEAPDSVNSCDVLNKTAWLKLSTWTLDKKTTEGVRTEIKNRYSAVVIEKPDKDKVTVITPNVVEPPGADDLLASLFTQFAQSMEFVEDIWGEKKDHKEVLKKLEDCSYALEKLEVKIPEGAAKAKHAYGVAKRELEEAIKLQNCPKCLLAKLDGKKVEREREEKAEKIQDLEELRERSRAEGFQRLQSKPQPTTRGTK